MPISKGEDWGTVGPLPADAPRASDDAELAAIIGPHLDAGTIPPVVGLLGGDLCRTIGGPADLDRPDAAIVPVDVCRVVVDGDEASPEYAVAHVVVRRPTWTGPITVVANAEFVGSADVAPRSHPGDGKVDVVTVAGMSWRDRLVAARRLPTGDHVPHAAITIRRRDRVEIDLVRGQRVWLDGRRLRRIRSIALSVIPDAITVAV